MTILAADFTDCAAIPVAVTMSRPSAAPEPGLPDDARLYLRHVERGESIRALARELGCHASTVLRRIRRFEARRDDPLVDRAVDQAVDPVGGVRVQPWSPVELAQARRVLRRMAEPGAVLAVAEGMDKAIVTRDDIRIAVLSRALAERLALMGWVALRASGRITRHAITPAGRAALKHMIVTRGRTIPGGGDFMDAHSAGQPVVAQGMAESQAAFDHADSHRIWDERDIDDPDGDGRIRARINIAESPLQMLARRRDADGRPFLDAALVGAGERLREDFELAQMGPRVTQNWDRFMTSGVDVSRSVSGYVGGCDGARDRVARALRDLGPGMGDMVLRVCCFLEGIEMTERRLGWSARSGKIVLRLALMRLDRHYQDNYGGGSPLIG